MKEVTDEEFQAAIASGKVLVDFYGTWCQPCKPLNALLEKIEPDFPDITFLKVNIDESPDCTTLCGVGALPTLVLFEDGEQIKEHLGGLSEPALRAWLRV